MLGIVRFIRSSHLQRPCSRPQGFNFGTRSGPAPPVSRIDFVGPACFRARRPQLASDDGCCPVCRPSEIVYSTRGYPDILVLFSSRPLQAERTRIQRGPACRVLWVPHRCRAIPILEAVDSELSECLGLCAKRLPVVRKIPTRSSIAHKSAGIGPLDCLRNWAMRKLKPERAEPPRRLGPVWILHRIRMYF